MSQNYLEILSGTNLAVVPGSKSFQAQFLAGQLSILDSFCALINDTVTTSLSLFLRQQFISAQVLTDELFYERMNLTINRFLLDMSFSLRHTLDYSQAITHGNAIMSTYVSNWRFIPSSVINSSTIRTRPVWYGNCSCAKSSQCLLPMSIDNATFPGLSVGCLPSTVLLQSTLECFFNQTCLETLHNALFDSVHIPSLPTSVAMSNRFPSNTLVGSLFDELFIESWFRQIDYETFFQTCEVSLCTYIYTQKLDILFVITSIIGLFGGLTIVLRIVCPLLIMGCWHLLRRIGKMPPIPIET